jgi:hypothetical protein
MDRDSNLNPTELLRDLDESEQEIFTAGQNSNTFGNSDFFLQITDISTEANNKLNLSGGESGSQNTKYNFSQITIGYSINLTLLNLWDKLQKLRGFFG